MTTADPISLSQAKRLAANADTILLRATRPADLETPIGAFLRLDDGGPAYLLESVEGGERLGRYSFLGVGPRRLLEVRDGRARIQTRPVTVPTYTPDLPIETVDARRPARRHPRVRPAPPRRADRGHAALHRRRGRGHRVRRRLRRSRPTVPLPDRDPIGVPTAAFIETDLVLVFDHLTHTLSAIASLHTERARPRGPLPDRRGRPSSRRSSGRLARARRSSPGPRHAAERRPRRARPIRSRRASVATSTSTRSRSPRTRSRPARRSRSCSPGASRSTCRPTRRPGDRSTASACTASLRRVNPSPYLFFVRTPQFEVVGASPELLLQAEGDKLTTHPIAGTRPRGADAREDEILAEQLQKDPKERAEHVMLVDLGRNDLGRVSRAGTVTVSKYMEVERYSHVLHLVSHVEGRLKPELDALDALRAVFPAGTLSGAPKVRAMQLIAAAEGERRGLYGGAVGYLGYDGNLDTAITIRSAVLKDGQAHVHTGAGIVAGSVPESEFEETEHKAAALRRAIEQAAGIRRDAAGRAEPDEPVEAAPMILVVDNYDSFTFNLVQALQAAGADVQVLRNDAIDRAGVEALADDPSSDLRGIVISPGPGRSRRRRRVGRDASRSPPSARSRSSASASACSRWPPPTGPRSSARRRSSTARRPR